ncbi:uncharacterized protein [Physcomitrium patens]|uniref:uncharacterized protein n=1 Tax=Physcomitrium patens TaxID=3218 RepID=UPI003CCDA1BB
MAASKKLIKFFHRVLHISPQSYKPPLSRHLSAASNSFESSSLNINSGRSWGSVSDAHCYDSDEEHSSPPADVPVGCLAVYVGKERRRHEESVIAGMIPLMALTPMSWADSDRRSIQLCLKYNPVLALRKASQ